MQKTKEVYEVAINLGRIWGVMETLENIPTMKNCLQRMRRWKVFLVGQRSMLAQDKRICFHKFKHICLGNYNIWKYVFQM